MEDVNAYMEIIKENIEYEHHMKYGRWQDKGLYEELYEVICEIVCVKHKTVKIGGNDYPYELVKSKFLKLHFRQHCPYFPETGRSRTPPSERGRAYPQMELI